LIRRHELVSKVGKVSSGSLMKAGNSGPIFYSGAGPTTRNGPSCAQGEINCLYLGQDGPSGVSKKIKKNLLKGLVLFRRLLILLLVAFRVTQENPSGGISSNLFISVLVTVAGLYFK
jgi:hypothetical protein